MFPRRDGTGLYHEIMMHVQELRLFDIGLLAKAPLFCIDVQHEIEMGLPIASKIRFLRWASAANARSISPLEDMPFMLSGLIIKQQKTSRGSEAGVDVNSWLI